MKEKTKNRIRVISWILFVIYIGGLIYLLFLSEKYGRVGNQERSYRYNLVLFQEIRRFWRLWRVVGIQAAFLNLAGNVLGFVPFGFFVPILNKRLRKSIVITVLGFLMSLTVELIQLVTKVGCFDVDDLLLNTLGAFFGYLFFWICNEIRKLIYEKKV